MDYIKSNVTAGFCFCLYYFVILCIFLFLQNVVMQLWTWCLSFIGLHWYCEYTQKVSPNCICYSCKCRCVANEIEFCCSCYLGVLLLKLSFMVFYRNLNVIVRDGNVLDAEWTRSQPFHSSATEWSGLEWWMRGVILRPDTKSPPLSLPLFKVKSQLVMLHSSEVKLGYSLFAHINVLHYINVQVFFLSSTLWHFDVMHG